MNFKKIAASVLATVMTFGMVACGSTEAPKETQKEQPSQNTTAVETEKGVIELKFPSYKTGENVGAVFFEPQVERFNEQYAGKYHITLESVPQNDFNERLKQLAQQKALPPLVQGGDPDWIKNVVIPNGMAMDLSEWMAEHPEVEKVCMDDSIEYIRQLDGKLSIMPAPVVRPIGFFYNSAIWNPEVDLSQLSVDEFIQELGDQKIALMTGENGWTTILLYTALIANQEGGADLLNAGIDEKITDFNQAPFINAAAQLQGLFKTNCSDNAIGAAYPDAANAFMSNKAAIICNGAWMSGDFSENNSANWSNGFNGADVRASLFPGQVGIAATRIFGEYWIPANTPADQVEAALAFIEFVYSPAELEAYMIAEGGDCPGLEYSDEFAAEIAKKQVMADISADTTEEAVFVPNLGDVMPNSVFAADFGRLLPSLADGSMSPEEFCNQLTLAAVEASAE